METIGIIAVLILALIALAGFISIVISIAFLNFDLHLEDEDIEGDGSEREEDCAD